MFDRGLRPLLLVHLGPSAQLLSVYDWCLAPYKYQKY